MKTNSKPKLVFLVNSLSYFFTHRLCLAIAAREDGFEVFVAAPGNPNLEKRLSSQGINFCEIGMDRKSMNPFAEIITLIRIGLLFRKLQPEVLHFVALKSVAYGGVVARILGLRGVICSVAGLGYSFTQKGLRPILARTFLTAFFRGGIRNRARVIFQNPDDENVLIKIGAVTANQTLLIKGAGVNTQKFAPRRDDISRSTPVVALIARMLWAKGVREFYAAAQALKQDGISARFLLIGGADCGNPDGVPTSVLQDWHREGVIEWKGHVDDVANALEEVDIACLPSTYGEGLPKSLIEAASCGIPIVTTDTPGCREICHDDWNGYLVPPKNPAALEQSLRKLILDNSLRKQMGERGRKMVEEGFSEDLVVSRTLDLYRSCAADAQQRQSKSQALILSGRS